MSPTIQANRFPSPSVRFQTVTVALLLAFGGQSARGETARGETVVAAQPLVLIEGLESPPESSEGVQSLLTEILRAQIPQDYLNEKDWGQTKEVTRGIHIKRDGLRITTKRRRKNVNHGTWKRYHVKMLNPEEHFEIRIENYTEQPNHRAAFDLVVNAKLDVSGRVAKYERGLKLFSISAKADSQVQLRLRCDVGLKVDFTKLPPDVMLDPRITDANLLLKDFHLRELSDLRGSAVKTLSSSVREAVEDVIEAKREHMVAKINAKIDKSRDRLRLSFHEMLKTPWANKLQPMPEASSASSSP